MYVNKDRNIMVDIFLSYCCYNERTNGRTDKVICKGLNIQINIDDNIQELEMRFLLPIV